MKRMTFHGPGHILEVAGYFTVGRDIPVDIDDHLARTLLVANPDLILSVEDIPAKNHLRPAISGGVEPEADNGEGQPTTTDERN